MAHWAAASLPFFLYIGVLSVVLPGLSRRARSAALLTVLAGLTLTVAGGHAQAFWMRLVVLPPIVLLVAYWACGLLWRAPMPRAERLLAASDAALRIPRVAARLPRALVEVLELAYVGVYPLVPLALVLHLSYSASPDADRFWTVMLAADFICFGMLPWLQTRPPRALEAGSPWGSILRPFNLGLAGRLSIGANTVPSGHAAEAVAAALLLSDAPLPVAALMWVIALAISAGAVFGRYHYALDAVAGWVVAALVWNIF